MRMYAILEMNDHMDVKDVLFSTDPPITVFSTQTHTQLYSPQNGSNLVMGKSAVFSGKVRLAPKTHF